MQLTHLTHLPAYALSLLASSAALLWPRSSANSRRLLVIVAALCWLIGLIVALHGMSPHDIYRHYSDRPQGVRIGLVGSSLFIAVLSMWALLPLRTSAHWRHGERQRQNVRWRHLATLLGFSIAALLLMAVVADLWEVRRHALTALRPPPLDHGMKVYGGFVIPLTAYDANAVGYVLTMWLPLAMLTAALWSLRSERWQALKRLASYASWPLWTLGLVLLAFAEQLAQRGITNAPLLPTERLQQALDTLTDARWLLVSIGFISLLVLIRQLRHLPATTLRGWSVGVFVVGVASFAATRSMAHDTQLVHTFDRKSAYGSQIPITASLPSGETCNTPATKDTVQLEITADSTLLGGHLMPTPNDASEMLDRKVELWRTFNPNRPLSMQIQISTDPETPTERHAAFEQMLKAVLKRHPTIRIERLFITQLTTIQTRTLDRPIQRAQLCVMSFQP